MVGLNVLIQFIDTSRKLAITALPSTKLSFEHLFSDCRITYFILFTHHHTFKYGNLLHVLVVSRSVQQKRVSSLAFLEANKANKGHADMI